MTGQLWSIHRMRVRPGRFLNSPTIEEWSECGVIRAGNEDAAGLKALRIVGRGPVRVEPVSEFYRPTSLQP